MDQEDKRTAASYIYNFFETVRVMTATYAQYANVMQEIKGRTGKDNIIQLEDEDNKVIMFSMQQFRGIAISAYVQFKALESTAKIKVPEGLEAQYKAVYDAKIIEAKDCEKFVISMNVVLVENVMQSLMQSAIDITNQIYDAPPK